MLTFLRKHQKVFFIFITIIIVVSFAFFGTFSPMAAPEDPRLHQVAMTTYEGRAVTVKELEGLKRLLGTSFGETPNLLGGDFVYREFLRTKGAMQLAERHLDALKDELEEKFQKAALYQPYVHPEASFISAKNVWERFIPEMNVYLDALKDKDFKKQLHTWLRLYVAQQKFPPEMLGRVLFFQMQQSGGKIQVDPHFSLDKVSLFGFHTLEDWLGNTFMQLIAESIFQGAALAKQKGFKVSRKEAKEDLLARMEVALIRSVPEEERKHLNRTGLYHRQLQMLGMEEGGVLHLWEQALLFSKLFEAAGKTLAFDPLFLGELTHFSQETAVLETYQLPEALRLKDFRSFLKFQYYIDAVGVKSKNRLALPTAFLSVQEVAKKVPELVQREYHVEYAEVKKDTLVLQVPLKDTWEWELDEKHFAEIQQKFPLVAVHKAANRSERFSVLEKLEPEVRLKVDDYARQEIAHAHPEWISEALEKAPLQSVRFPLSPRGGSLPFQGIEDRKTFFELLAKAPLKSESASLGPLSAYSGDGKTFYRINVLEREPHMRVIRFEEALREDILGKLLDRSLEEAYPEVRKKDPAPFEQKGGWKPFAEVKDEVGARVYADVLKALREASGKKKLSLSEYSAYRFLPYMEEMRKLVEMGKEISTEGEGQWRLVKQTKEMKRKEGAAFFSQVTHLLKEGEFSSVQTPAHGDISFCRLLQRKIGEEKAALDPSAHELIEVEARSHLMQELLDLYK